MFLLSSAVRKQASLPGRYGRCRLGVLCFDGMLIVYDTKYLFIYSVQDVWLLVLYLLDKIYTLLPRSLDFVQLYGMVQWKKELEPQDYL